MILDFEYLLWAERYVYTLDQRFEICDLHHLLAVHHGFISDLNVTSHVPGQQIGAENFISILDFTGVGSHDLVNFYRIIFDREQFA